MLDNSDKPGPLGLAALLNVSGIIDVYFSYMSKTIIILPPAERMPKQDPNTSCKVENANQES